MEHFLSELGNPHLAAPVVHIAGTKGKGSVSWLIAESLRRSGFSVGLYTSPHLIHLEERFVIDGLPCSPGELAASVEGLRDAAAATAKSPHGAPTFFEMTTALAWSLFAQRKTQINIIEVGLGGRLDSTNVCESSLAVITSISFDHQQQLGNTISLIAAEKAGIIKSKVPVISGARHLEAQHVIREKCQSSLSPLWELGVNFEVSSVPQCIGGPSVSPHEDSDLVASTMNFIPLHRSAEPSELQSSFASLKLNNLKLRMLGAHQAENAAIAIAACQRLVLDGWRIPSKAIQDALADTQISCRVELVANDPMTIIDTSHNVASIAALIEALKNHFAPSKRTVVFACSKDKEYEKMVEQVLAYADRVILTQFQSNPRTVLVEKLEELAREKQSRYPDVEVLAAPNSRLAVEHALITAIRNELICVTGSFFLASEVRPMFDDKIQQR